MLGIDKTHKQRQYLYQNINKVIAGLFDLVLKVHQDSALAAVGLENHLGCCRGFAEYWEQHLISQDASSIAAKHPDFLPLNDIILRLQNSEGWMSTIGKSLRCKRFNTEAQQKPWLQMVEYMLSEYIAPHQTPGCMQVLSIGKSAPSSFNCIMPGITTTRMQRTLWHEVRIYHDQDGYVHWFDANIGWFKSCKPYPSQDIITAFLVNLFEFMQYQNFTACAMSACYAKICGIKPKLRMSC